VLARDICDHPPPKKTAKRAAQGFAVPPLHVGRRCPGMPSVVKAKLSEIRATATISCGELWRWPEYGPIALWRQAQH